VKFTPTSDTEPASGTLILTNNDPASPNTVTLSGTGVKPTLELPASLAFGEVRVTESVDRTVVVRNTGTGPIHITRLSITSGRPFRVSPSEAFDLPAGTNKELVVTFSPGTEASAAATLTLTTNDPVITSASMSLSGTGVRPTLSLSPIEVAFGEQRVGSPSTAQPVTVKNTGSGILHVTGLSIPSGSPFTLSSIEGFSLAPQASRDLLVRFTPSAEGDASSTLTVTTNDPVSPKTVSFSGTGVKPR
jgi:hypothetical protein